MFEDNKKNSLFDKENGNKYNKQLQIISIFLFLIAALTLIGLISYTPMDEDNADLSIREFFSLFLGNEAAQAKADTTHNWLGLLGAVVSNLLFNKAFGYASIIIPILIGFWGYYLIKFKKVDYTLLARTSLGIGIILSSAALIGSVRQIEWMPTLAKEWSGAVGMFLASVAGNIIGKVGALLLYLVIFAVVLIFGANKELESFSTVFKLNKGKFLDKFNRFKHKSKPKVEKAPEPEIVEEKPPIKPIKPIEPIIQAPIQSETSEEPIRIIRRNAPVFINRKNYEFNDEIETEQIQNNLAINEQNKPRPINNSLNINIEKPLVRTENIVAPQPQIYVEEPILEEVPKASAYDDGAFKTVVFEKAPEESPFVSEVPLPFEHNQPYIESQNFEIHENIKINEAPINHLDNIPNEYIPEQDVEIKEELIPEPIANNQNLNPALKRIMDDEIPLRSEVLEMPKHFKTSKNIEIETIPPIPSSPAIVEEIKNEPNIEQEEYYEAEALEPEMTAPLPKLPFTVQKPLDFTPKPESAWVEEDKVPEVIEYKPLHVELLVIDENLEPIDEAELQLNAKKLQEKLETFKIYIENLTVTPGPVVTQYEFVPAPGIKISQIENLTDDIALALKARGIRIIAPVPGKGTVGIEIPNHRPQIVRFSDVVRSNRFNSNEFRLPIALGKDIVGEVKCADLAKMPHLLIAGSTGSGKSVGINTLICSLLYKLHPDDLKFVIIDPKKVELSHYAALKDHYLAVCPDIDELIVTNPVNAVLILKSLVAEMERRYDILASAGQRNIVDYNAKLAEGKIRQAVGVVHTHMPYIVCVIDELADLMLTASKEVEEPIIRLAQLARAIGIHLVIATQRPSVDVITGIIKANFPARMAYLVASRIDSRTILDMSGAEHLLGNGDMLFLPGGFPRPERVQNAFISNDEVEAICDYIGAQRGYSEPYTLPSIAPNQGGTKVGSASDRDALFEEAAHIIVRHQQASVSLLQRRLKVGYARAARIMDEIEEAGIVGSFDGGKARSVLLESEADLEAYI